MRVFWIRVADITIQISAIFSYAKKYCRDYLIENTDKEAADITIKTKESDITEIKKYPEVTGSSDEFLETLCIHELLTVQMVKKGRFLMHGAVISYNGDGFMFTAPSGTGKSTHIRLWKRYLGEKVKIVNGDKPYLSVESSGSIRVWGSPWAGKERWQQNCNVILRGICVIVQGTKNIIRQLSPDEALEALFGQIYHKNDAETEACTLEFLDKLLRGVPVYQMECDMSENAVKCSFEAMTGLKYTECSRND